jgi:protocatechuate 3,4-dioxygenase beta subunit
MKTTIDRRTALTMFAGAATSLVACGGERAIAAPSGATIDGASLCKLTAEQEEGPYYVPLKKIRSHIADGQPGAPLAITFRVVDVTTCRPLPNVAVDVWHCNAAGTYSDAAHEGTAGDGFLRGIQLTDANGEATFQTIFPGWYRGRTVHIHVKARTGGAATTTYTDGRTCHTGDVFFPQETNDAMAAAPLYSTASTNAGERTRNADDGVWRTQNGGGSVCTVSGAAATGLTASIVLAVDPRATPAPVGFRRG